MKTHKEIHDAIQTAPLSGPESIQLYNILHALNDRIEALDKDNTASFKQAFAYIQELDDAKAPR